MAAAGGERQAPWPHRRPNRMQLCNTAPPPPDDEFSVPSDGRPGGATLARYMPRQGSRQCVWAQYRVPSTDSECTEAHAARTAASVRPRLSGRCPTTPLG